LNFLTILFYLSRKKRKISPDEIENFYDHESRLSTSGTINLSGDKKGNLDKNELKAEIEKIKKWIEDVPERDNHVRNAKERILYSLELIDELMNDEMREKQPILCCTMIPQIIMMLMSNCLHLHLHAHGLLKGDMPGSSRPVVHCHHPKQLWELLKDKKGMEDHEKERVSRAMDLFSFDSRYPHGSNHEVARRLVAVAEMERIKMVAEEDQKKKSERLQELSRRRLNEIDEKLSLFVGASEKDLFLCLKTVNKLRV
jgi:hypothetical protein